LIKLFVQKARVIDAVFLRFFFLSNFIRIAITQKQDLPPISFVQKHLLDAFTIRWTRQLRQISRFKHRKKIHLDVTDEKKLLREINERLSKSTRRTSEMRVSKINKILRKLCREAAELFQLVNKEKTLLCVIVVPRRNQMAVNCLSRRRCCWGWKRKSVGLGVVCVRRKTGGTV